jgi:hypothetical protein
MIKNPKKSMNSQTWPNFNCHRQNLRKLRFSGK